MIEQPRFPMTALVGVDDLRLALLLNAIDPKIGGVLIRGDKGTTVTLLVRHVNNSETISIEIERDIIKRESVTLLMQVGRIGHLRLSGFTGTTNDDLEDALERFERSQGVGLVLDLRNNPGGLVSSVVEVTSQFIKDGLVLYQIDARGNRRNWGVL